MKKNAMKTGKDIKEEVKEKYGKLAAGALQSIASPRSCCGGGSSEVVNISLRYDDADRSAIPEGADLGLGCGTPAAFADLQAGMTVLDLGSGAGIDCFVAAKHVGERGRVIGVDMTEAMIAKANENKAKVEARNVEFRLGEIESLPVENVSVDRVISNCVINLVPNKEKAFGEIFRVLKKGGKFTVSDIVVDGEISDEERQDASLWAGCVSGALDRSAYMQIIQKAGFSKICVIAEKQYDYRLKSNARLFSITVTGEKK